MIENWVYSEYFIYIITNLINEKQYVGRSEFERRCHSHIKYKSSNRLLRLDIGKYGLENFQLDITIYKNVTLAQMHKKENELILELQTLYPLGYNLKLESGKVPVRNSKYKIPKRFLSMEG